MKLSACHIFIALLALCMTLGAQNQAKKWYFGTNAGLDFTTSPPTVLTNGSMSSAMGCASIADANANLLFYTNGLTVWNQAHAVMANGTALLGNNNSWQPAIIVKQPGNANLYYVFTVQGQTGSSGLNYSIVDMSLAAGMGSVTAKNVAVFSGSCSAKVAATKHCNGNDVWVVMHEYNSNNFRSYLLTSAGLNPTAVVTGIGTIHSSLISAASYNGDMKISPFGKQICLAIYGSVFEVFDFNATTGVITNSLSLGTSFNQSYGCAFSPDGSKLYLSNPNKLYQWDLCAGSGVAIAASQYTTATSNFSYGGIQLAPDGKLYIARIAQTSLSVVNNPNVGGAGCNYVDAGQTISPKTSGYGLPNFVSNYINSRPPVSPFTYTVNNAISCQTASFTAAGAPSLTGCPALGYSLTGIAWNFGDPASGPANTSFLVNPDHTYASIGTYTVKLVYYYSCGGGTDTLSQLVNISQPCITVSSTSITCASLGSATVTPTAGAPSYNYTWMPTGQTGSVATGLSPGTYTLSFSGLVSSAVFTTTTSFISLVPLTGTLSSSPTIPCNGASTGTAAYTNLSGGSANQNYSWTNGTLTTTAVGPVNLGAGTWSSTVTDALTGCVLSNTFLISQPPALTLNISGSIPTACAGTSLVLTGTNNGGTPGYTYLWVGGQTSTTLPVIYNAGATAIYTLSSNDTNNCTVTNTIGVSFAPTASATANSPLCNGQTLMLSGGGGLSYNWSGPAGFNSALQSPSFVAVTASTGVYNLMVTSVNGCTNAASTAVLVNPTPTISVVAGTTCVNASLDFTAVSIPGASYSWSGVNAFTSSGQNPLINPAALVHSGVYTVTVISVNGCTNSASASAVVNPLPILSVSDVSICPLAFGNLTAGGASTYTWSNAATGSVLTDNPSNTTQYTVTGAALNCTAAATASIILKTAPVPTLNTNGPRCNGSNLILSALGGIAYAWNGPLGFSSGVQNPTLNAVGLTNAGVYNLTVTAANTCTASTNTTVIVNPTPTVSASASVACTIQTLNLNANSVAAAAYVWSGPQSFTSALQNPSIASPSLSHSGIYNLTVTSLDGCTNTASTLASVVNPPNLLISLSSPSMCAQALSGSPNTIILNSSGAATYTLSTPNHIYNTNPSGPASPLSLLPPYNPTGPATATLFGSNGVCTVSTTAVFSIVPNPTLSVLNPTPVICAGQNFTYTSNGASSYSWTSANPNNYLYTTGNVAVANPSINAVFSVVGGSLGCNSAIQTSTLTVNPLPVFNISGNNLICPGSAAVLSAVGTATVYNWSPNIFLNTSSSGTVLASPPSVQNYLVTGSLNNCTNTAMVTVSVLPLPLALITAPKTVFCQDDEIILFGNGGLTHAWKGPSGYGASGQNISVKALSPAFSGNYTLTVSDANNCKASTTQLITVNKLPQGYLSAKSMEGCAPFCPDLSFKQPRNNTAITDLSWQVNGAVINGTGFKYCFDAPGDYKITGTISDVNNCVSSLTTGIRVFPNPVADFSFLPEQPVENLEEVQFSAVTKDITNYNWTIGSSANSSTKKDPAFLFENTGVYPVALVVKNKWQCSDTVVKTIYVAPDFAVYVPNAFTPNADGLNELFIPVIRGNKSFVFSIFDRWGAKLYETTDLSRGWDGTYKGEVCQQDSYVWKLVVKAADAGTKAAAQSKELIGNVLLYR